MRWAHRIKHWLHTQPVVVVTEWRGTELWIGGKCAVCGEVSSWFKGGTTRPAFHSELISPP